MRSKSLPAKATKKVWAAQPRQEKGLFLTWLVIGKLNFEGFFCTFEEKMYPSVSANSLDVFISSLDKELEIGAATQFSKFFTLKKRLRPESINLLSFFRHLHSAHH